MGHRPYNCLWTFLVLALVLAYAQAAGQELIRKEISGSKVKELKATIDLSFGHVSLKRSRSDKIAVIEFTKPEDPDEDLEVKYSVDGQEGRLVIRSQDKASLWDRGSEDRDREWFIELTDRIPISLHFKLGAGEGELDVTGLQLRNLKISTGASAVRLDCDQPNAIHAESIDIESGVSKLTARNLCNTNFNEMNFSGGVGTYFLDFGGMLTRNAHVTIEVGLGAVTVSLPQSVPVRIKHEDSWFSSFDLDDDFQKKGKGVYESYSYGSSRERLLIAIESGLGSIKIRRK